MLELINVAKSFGRTQVLRPTTLTMERGGCARALRAAGAACRPPRIAAVPGIDKSGRDAGRLQGSRTGAIELNLVLFHEPDRISAVGLEATAAIRATADQERFAKLVRLADLHAGKGIAYLAADFVDSLSVWHVLFHRHSLPVSCRRHAPP